MEAAVALLLLVVHGKGTVTGTASLTSATATTTAGVGGNTTTGVGGNTTTGVGDATATLTLASNHTPAAQYPVNTTNTTSTLTTMLRTPTPTLPTNDTPSTTLPHRSATGSVTLSLPYSTPTAPAPTLTHTTTPPLTRTASPPLPTPTSPAAAYFLLRDWCRRQGSAVACTRDADCLWDGTSGVCIVSTCLLHPEHTCHESSTADTCWWDASASIARCRLDRCRDYGSERACRAPACTWTTESGGYVCRSRRCRGFSDAFQCEGSDECTWHVATLECHERACTSFPDPTTCPPHFGCEWTGSCSKSVAPTPTLPTTTPVPHTTTPAIQVPTPSPSHPVTDALVDGKGEGIPVWVIVLIAVGSTILVILGLGCLQVDKLPCCQQCLSRLGCLLDRSGRPSEPYPDHPEQPPGKSEHNPLTDLPRAGGLPPALLPPKTPPPAATPRTPLTPGTPKGTPKTSTPLSLRQQHSAPPTPRKVTVVDGPRATAHIKSSLTPPALAAARAQKTAQASDEIYLEIEHLGDVLEVPHYQHTTVSHWRARVCSHLRQRGIPVDLHSLQLVWAGMILDDSDDPAQMGITPKSTVLASFTPGQAPPSPTGSLSHRSPSPTFQ